jgi:hypothetical protein
MIIFFLKGTDNSITSIDVLYYTFVMSASGTELIFARLFFRYYFSVDVGGEEILINIGKTTSPFFNDKIST